MKKFLFYGLLLASLPIHAQWMSTAIDVVGGLNRLHAFSKAVPRDSKYNLPHLGWSVGLDYTLLSFTRLFDLKMGFRYQESTSVLQHKNLRYPSEYVTGTYVYNPALSHSTRTETRHQDWLYLGSCRIYFNRLKTWRCYFHMEGGFAYYQGESPSLGVTASYGLGVQWLPPQQRLGVFLQPQFRLWRFEQNSKREEYPVFMPVIELGLRTRLTMAQQ